MSNWKIFYNNIKDERWPECNSTADFVNLPKHIQDEIRTVHKGEFADIFDDIELQYWNPIKNDPNNALSATLTNVDLTKKFNAGDIAVHYADWLDGGGTGFGQNYSKVIKKIYPNRKFKHCMEWCAGPGFIGFRILSDQLCEQLTLVEGYYPAIQSLETTYKNLQEQYKTVTNIVHLSDISNLDKTLQFDLIVGNPPFFNQKTFYNSWMAERTSFDWGWKTHNNFFQHISNHLTDDGRILLQESSYGSGPDDFKDSIESNGLQISSSFTIANMPSIWFLEIIKK